MDNNTLPLGTSGHNIIEYSVSEISQALKKTVEQGFAHVRVKGEISELKKAASGHIYMTLKDDSANLSAICWRGVANKLAVQPEEGLEVVVTGKLTTYPGRSNYQIIIEKIEVSGVGALLKQLEMLKKRLEAEGLFSVDKKRLKPYLPKCIGVITSPTGSVIRDILHRLDDRFPRHVLVWGVPVQGPGAAQKIANAIDGFTHFEKSPQDETTPPKPDLLIVARGGGSLEDLWAFNEEVVVRAVARCDIPLISAIGHETDTTLIDYVADYRAPTPTGAAEIAVPVRTQENQKVQSLSNRIFSHLTHRIEGHKRHLLALSMALPKPDLILSMKMQRLDDISDRFNRAIQGYLKTKKSQLSLVSANLMTPKKRIELSYVQLQALANRLKHSINTALMQKENIYAKGRYNIQLKKILINNINNQKKSVISYGKLLESYSYKNVLKRGYALVHNPKDETLIKRRHTLKKTAPFILEFYDGPVSIYPAHEKGTQEKRNQEKKRKKKPTQGDRDSNQGQLF